MRDDLGVAVDRPGVGRCQGQGNGNVVAAVRGRRDRVIAEDAAAKRTCRHCVGRGAVADMDDVAGIVAQHPVVRQRVDGNSGQCFAAVGIGQGDALQEANGRILARYHIGHRHRVGHRLDIQIEHHAIALEQRVDRRIGIRILGAQGHLDPLEVAAEMVVRGDYDGGESGWRGFQIVPGVGRGNRVGRATGNGMTIHIDRAVAGRVGEGNRALFAAIEIGKRCGKEGRQVQRRIFADRGTVRGIRTADLQIDQISHSAHIDSDRRARGRPGNPAQRIAGGVDLVFGHAHCRREIGGVVRRRLDAHGLELRPRHGQRGRARSGNHLRRWRIGQ